jgi:hypothetical protein
MLKTETARVYSRRDYWLDLQTAEKWLLSHLL